jgi:protein O-mannosyl-transferase
VAALFAWHPLHVESVAWVAERKDVLSTFFGLLTLTAYPHYARLRDSQQGRFRIYYVLALVSFALGLMSKPMVVTLPFLLLLVDFWPLRRMQVSAPALRRLVVEKLPFLLLSAAGCLLTLRAQQEVILDAAALPFGKRLVNALLSYAVYLRKMIWPADLAAFYPYQQVVPATDLIIAVLALGLLSFLSLRLARRAPYLLFGWLWYLGMLVPVIGLVQVGAQSLADRYTYLPLVGIFVMGCWGAADALASRVPKRPVLAGGVATALLATCLWVTWNQQQYWRDSETLFRRDLKICPADNAMAHHCLGRALFLKGDDPGAIEHYQEVLRLLPNLADAHVSMANSLNRLGKYDGAMSHYREAIRLDPKHAEAYKSLGSCLAAQMKLDEARTNFLIALELKPDYAQAHTRLGTLLMAQGDVAGALKHLTRATEIYPDFDEGQYYLANALVDQKRFAEAAQHFRAAIRANPDYAAACNDLAWMLATQAERNRANLAEAIAAARKACELTGGTNASQLMTLGVAYSEAGQFAEAIAATEKAAAVASDLREGELMEPLQKNLLNFRAGRSATGRAPPGELR